MRKSLIALMALPALALAQAQGGKSPATPQAGQAAPPDQGRIEKRMRLARTLGLAEVLDLDTAQALKLGDTLAKFDEKRNAVRKQASDATTVLRNSARGTGTPAPTAADVDAAIKQLLDARAQLHALDRDMLQAITRDLSPQQKARAALFLGHFRRSIERHMWMAPGMGPGPGGPGGAAGPGGPGMMRGGMTDRDQQGMRMRMRWGDDDQLAGEPPPFADEDD